MHADPVSDPATIWREAGIPSPFGDQGRITSEDRNYIDPSAVAFRAKRKLTSVGRESWLMIFGITAGQLHRLAAGY
jgi:hypothetical protein